MKIDFSPRLFFEGFGNINYQVPDISASTLTAAADGTSVEAATPHIVRLGQDVGQAGNPAALTEEREIPLNNFIIAFSGSGKVLIGKTAADGTAAILQTAGDIAIDNPNGFSALRFNATSAEDFLQFLAGAAQTFMGAVRNTRAYTSIGENAGGGATGTQVSNPPVSITAFGFNALANLNFPGFNSSAFGVNALRNMISAATPYSNDAFGCNALEQVTDGVGNVGVGYQAGFNLIHDTLNTLIGNSVMTSPNSGNNGQGARGSNNTLMGYAAGGVHGGIYLAVTTLFQGCIIIGEFSGVFTEGVTLSNTMILVNNLFTDLSNLAFLSSLTQNAIIGAALTGETDNGAKLQVRGNISGQGTRKAHRAITASAAFTKNDDNLLVDTTAGNVVVTIDPTIDGMEGTIKKTSADVNTVTLQPASGTIQGFGAPAASYIFNVQGESIAFFSDGINLYIK
jgi:hypothetical protein